MKKILKKMLSKIWRPNRLSDPPCSGPIPRCSIEVPMPKVKPPKRHEQDVPEWAAKEIRETWNTAREAGGELQAFKIIERMVDRLGYGRRENNPSLSQNTEA